MQVKSIGMLSFWKLLSVVSSEAQGELISGGFFLHMIPKGACPHFHLKEKCALVTKYRGGRKQASLGPSVPYNVAV